MYNILCQVRCYISRSKYQNHIKMTRLSLLNREHWQIRCGFIDNTHSLEIIIDTQKEIKHEWSNRKNSRFNFTQLSITMI